MIIIALIVGFILGRLKINLKLPMINKIAKMRKLISDKSWLISKYKSLMEQEKENRHFYKFECESHFVGNSMAKHNEKIYYERADKTRRQRKFIESRIKLVDANYYIKYIGKISADEMLALRRNKKLNNLLN